MAATMATKKSARIQSTIELQEDIQWRISQDPNLSLVDLARVAPASRLFHNIYMEKRIAEEAWLDKLGAASDSMFGTRIVDVFCEWFATPLPQPPGEPAPGAMPAILNAYERGFNPLPPGRIALPEQQKYVTVAPAWGLRDGGQESQVLWYAGISPEGRGARCTTALDDFTLNLYCCDEAGWFGFDMGNSSSSVILPWMGFLHRVLQAEALQEVVPGSGRKHFFLRLPSALVRQGGPHRCNDAVEGGELQQAISALLMRHWPRWHFAVKSADTWAYHFTMVFACTCARH